jgi:hypothetical protein
MAYGFNIGTLVKFIIDRVLEIELLLVVYTDSKSLYECFVKLGTIREKYLIINIIYFRQVYERREIAEVKWIKGESNPADSIMKSKPTNTLKRLIDTNTI